MSGGDTNIKGAQVTGKGITVRAANLNIESLQDTADYHSRQQNIKGQVTVGYGVSASGDYSKSKINAEHRSVSEQSGLFAGDDGFDVQVGGHTQLTGGIITASQSAEEQGKNRFQSGSISQIDLHNISKYDGSSIGFGTSVAVSGKTLGQEQQAGKIQLSDVARQNASGFSSGYGRDSDHQESTTHSGIGTRNIILTDEAGQLAKTGYGTDKAIQLAYTDIRTEDAQAQSGSLKNRFDADKVQSELDLQRTVSQEFSQTSQQVNKAINQKIDAINSELEKGNLSDAEKNKLETQRDNWQYSKVLLNMVASGLSAPTQSGAGIAAATAAPAVSYEIGQYFKAQGQDGSLKHIVAHAILGAAVSAAGDNNVLAGALSAGGSEAAAPLISQWLYQEADGSKLTAEQKDTVNAITSALGAATGAAVGGTAADVAQGSLNAQNAVENNSQLFDDLRSWTKEKANNAAKSARELFPNTPALSGFFLGLGDVADGGLGLTDATAESLAMAIHCAGGGNYCNTAIKNNQERGRLLLDVAKSIPDGRIKSALEHWGHNLLHGTPEQRREATEQLARASTALGVGSAVGAPKEATGSATKRLVQQFANNKVWQPVNQALQKARLARELSKAGDNLPPVPLKPVPAIVKNKGTGTVFDFIKPTQPNYPGSVIPKSFEMSLPNGKKIWVHGNASEHLAEFAQYKAKNYIPETVRLTSQQQLRSLRASVYTATKNGIVYDKMIEVGGWQLKFQPPRQKGQHPALIHALPIQ